MREEEASARGPGKRSGGRRRRRAGRSEGGEGGDVRPSPVASLRRDEHRQQAAQRREEGEEERNGPVERVVGVASLTDRAAEGVRDVGARHLARLVDLGHVDLDRSVVLGDDEAVGRAALARDVEVDDLALWRGAAHARAWVSARPLVSRSSSWTGTRAHEARTTAQQGHARDEGRGTELTWSFCMVTALRDGTPNARARALPKVS